MPADTRRRLARRVHPQLSQVNLSAAGAADTVPAIHYYCIGGFRVRTFSPEITPTATFRACLPELGGLARCPATRIALYPTGRLYLYRFSPVPSLCIITACLAGVYTFNSGASPLPPAWHAWCGCLAVDGVNYTRLARHCQHPASTRRRSGDRWSRHACAHETATGESHGTAPVWRPRSATACGQLPIRI